LLHVFKISKQIRIKTVIKRKYLPFLPFFIKKHCIAIDKSNNFQKLKKKGKNNIGIWIEGTRSKKTYVHSGFYYIAKEMNADVLVGYLIILLKNINVY